MRSTRYRWAFGIAAVICLAGCGAPAPAVSFSAAQSANRPVTIEGTLQPGSVSRTTGRPTTFVLREAGTQSLMGVTAPESVPVPSNITTSKSVTVTGTYDSTKKSFVAREVQVRALNRSEQLHGS
jgi:hypothetical protein